MPWERWSGSEATRSSPIPSTPGARSPGGRGTTGPAWRWSRTTPSGGWCSGTRPGGGPERRSCCSPGIRGSRCSPSTRSRCGSSTGTTPPRHGARWRSSAPPTRTAGRRTGQPSRPSACTSRWRPRETGPRTSTPSAARSSTGAHGARSTRSPRRAASGSRSRRAGTASSFAPPCPPGRRWPGTSSATGPRWGRSPPRRRDGPGTAEAPARAGPGGSRGASADSPWIFTNPVRIE